MLQPAENTVRAACCPRGAGSAGSAVRRAASAAGAISARLSPAVNIAELEKHLDDWRAGRPELSGDTAGKLRDMHHNNASWLARTGGKASTLYLSYVTAMNYEQRARFTHAMNNCVDAGRGIGEPQAPAPDLQRALEAYAAATAASGRHIIA